MKLEEDTKVRRLEELTGFSGSESASLERERLRAQWAENLQEVTV